MDLPRHRPDPASGRIQGRARRQRHRRCLAGGRSRRRPAWMARVGAGTAYRNGLRFGGQLRRRSHRLANADTARGGRTACPQRKPACPRRRRGHGTSPCRRVGHSRAQCPRSGCGQAPGASITADLGRRGRRNDALRLVCVSGRLALTSLLVLALPLAACEGSQDSATPASEMHEAHAEDLRIVSLAPHIAELVFAVGAGELLVGVTAYTNYPDAAAKLPNVGDAFAVDQEQLAVLKPDLLLAWKSGTAAHVVDELRMQGYRVEVIETTSLNDIVAALYHIGRLTGRESQAQQQAGSFERGLDELAERYRNAPPISVFYQVSDRPLYTINGEHYVSELISICGGRNI